MNEPRKPLLPPGAELRSTPGKVELRANPDDPGSPGILFGHAAVFNVLSCDLGGFREKIAPGAFAGCMADDVRALKNHSENHLLGRSTAGTLRFEEDGAGLMVAIDLPDTQVGRDTATEIRRKDITGQSFCFVVSEGGDSWDWSGPFPVRTVNKVSMLYDVGPVTYPAYDGTDVAFRSAKSRHDEEVAEAAAEGLSGAKARLRIARERLL